MAATSYAPHSHLHKEFKEGQVKSGPGRGGKGACTAALLLVLRVIPSSVAFRY